MRTARPPVATVAVAANFILAWSAGAQPRAADYGWSHHNMMFGWGWPGMILGPVFGLATLVALVAVVAYVFRAAGRPMGDATPPRARDPLDILKERFARGEIDKAEYEARRQVLRD